MAPRSRLDACLAVLELSAGATRVEILAAYRRLCKRYHPDGYMGDPDKTRLANELLAEINAAYAYLMKAVG